MEKVRQVRIIINTVNDAFTPDEKGELARLLREIAATLDKGRYPNTLKDINGNKCGIMERF